jgi:ABC-type branched-subunit amino acid transport system permease subunit
LPPDAACHTPDPTSSVSAERGARTTGRLVDREVRRDADAVRRPCALRRDQARANVLGHFGEWPRQRIADTAAWLAVNVDPTVGLISGPLVGLGLGIVNGLIITGFRVHSFLATLATSLVFRGIAILISGGFLIPVRMPEFEWIGRGRVGMVNIAVIVLLFFVVAMMILLNRTTFGRRVYAIGGNEEAAVLSGVRVNAVKIGTFALRPPSTPGCRRKC